MSYTRFITSQIALKWLTFVKKITFQLACRWPKLKKNQFIKMNKKKFALVALLFFSISVYSQQWVDKKYAYDSLLNIPFGTAINYAGGTDTLHLDIYLPQCDDINRISKRPLLIWIHGGAFLAGDKNDVSIQDLCKQFAKRGYVTASIDYRLGFISDNVYWQCSYPNYSCVFATDSSEWPRAYYRSVQDGKGALRYLINRYKQFRIDTNNVFVAGESAGAFIALGISLLDTVTEKPTEAYSITNAPLPHSNNLKCVYNVGKTFKGVSVSRPDLGDIDGNIEPTKIHYTIKGIGNMYGAMFSDLLKYQKANKPKPSIFSFHQPCDIVVPIDSQTVFWGLTWCLTNGYGCYGIANNNIKLYGSRAISTWNTVHKYGYNIHNEFTTTKFPYNFLFGSGSCTDQVNKPCHAYDNKFLRENNLAIFFANSITTTPICDPKYATNRINSIKKNNIKIYPNPTQDFITIEMQNLNSPIKSILVNDIFGKICFTTNDTSNTEIKVDLHNWSNGLYIIKVEYKDGEYVYFKLLKQ